MFPYIVCTYWSWTQNSCFYHIKIVSHNSTYLIIFKSIEIDHLQQAFFEQMADLLKTLTVQRLSLRQSIYLKLSHWKAWMKQQTFEQFEIMTIDNWLVKSGNLSEEKKQQFWLNYGTASHCFLYRTTTSVFSKEIRKWSALLLCCQANV